MSGDGLPVWSIGLDECMLPLDCARRCAGLPRVAVGANGAQGTYPMTVGNGSETDAVGVIATVALVTEHHLVLVVGHAALVARLAVHALPFVEADGGQKFTTNIETCGM